jgi:hypothetical protein
MIHQYPPPAAGARITRSNTSQAIRDLGLLALSAVEEDVTSLCKRKMLSTRLLDFLIQQAAPPWTEHILDTNLANHVSLEVLAHSKHTSSSQIEANLNARNIQRIHSTVDALVHDKLQNKYSHSNHQILSLLCHCCWIFGKLQNVL